MLIDTARGQDTKYQCGGSASLCLYTCFFSFSLLFFFSSTLAFSAIHYDGLEYTLLHLLPRRCCCAASSCLTSLFSFTDPLYPLYQGLLLRSCPLMALTSLIKHLFDLYFDYTLDGNCPFLSLLFSILFIFFFFSAGIFCDQGCLEQHTHVLFFVDC